MADSGDETAARATEAGIYTETLARLYLQQGFAEKALRIYHHLVHTHPEDLELRERFKMLEQQVERPMQEHVASPPVVTVTQAMTNGPSSCTQWVLGHLEYWLSHLQQQRTVRENALHCEERSQRHDSKA
jgi:hypothetical protein